MHYGLILIILSYINFSKVTTKKNRQCFFLQKHCLKLQFIKKDDIFPDVIHYNSSLYSEGDLPVIFLNHSLNEEDEAKPH